MHRKTESRDYRALLATLHSAAVKGAAPLERTRTALREWLARNDHSNGDEPRRAHIIALGKASVAMAAGAADALSLAGYDVAGGVVVAAHDARAAEGGHSQLPPSLDFRIGDHPVPGDKSLAAAHAIGEAILAIEADDLPVVLLSGGTTALAAAPVPELSQLLGDEERAQARIANLADTLLESGLAIHEMNAIRRRVLRWGAGRLAVALAARGVKSIPVFAISDVIGDDPAVIGSGPCTADPFDSSYFLALLDAHDVRGNLESDMAKFLGVNGATGVPDVPPHTHAAFALVDYRLVARNRDAVSALAQAARDTGIEHVVVDDTPLEGEAAELGDQLARRAIAAVPSIPPGERALYVMGGEPVVHLRRTYESAWEENDVRDAELDSLAPSIDFESDSTAAPQFRDDDEPLSGGRMQALALSAALALENAMYTRSDGAWRVHVLAAGTDGRDGPTDAAGAIVDAAVPGLARRGGRKPERDLLTGRSWFSLDRAGALLRTGPTGTNVMDVVAVLIAE